MSVTKKIGLALMMATGLMTFSSHASGLSNDDCIRVYRDGYLDLKENIDLFNERSLNKWEFSAQVSAISGEVSGSRLLCRAFENPDARKCVGEYQELYRELRERISLTAVMAGNQTEITYASEVDSESGGIGGFFDRLRNRGSELAGLGELALIDRKCL